MSSRLVRHLQALAWCHFEEARGAPVRDAAIEQAAIAAGPDLPARIEFRADAFCVREGLAAALQRHLGRERLARRALLAGGLLIGAGAARYLPEGLPARANVVALLVALLLPNLSSLALWIALQAAAALRGRGVAGAWLGTTLARLADRAVPRLAGGDGDATRALQRALCEFHAASPAGRARVAQLSHAFWLAAGLGAMLGCWWLLVLRQVDFQWGSTLLGEEDVRRAIALVGAPLHGLGIPVPDAADLAASRVDAGPQASALRTRWAWFVLGSLGVWGLLPRVAALAACALAERWYSRRARFDLARAGFFRLRAILLPDGARSSILDADEAPPSPPVPPELPAGLSLPAGAAWLALERALPVPDGARNLGAVVDRAGQRETLALLAADTACPALVILAPLAATPDRGLAQFVAALVADARRPVFLRVADDGAGELAGAARAARVEDWWNLARAAGIAAERIDLGGAAAP